MDVKETVETVLDPKIVKFSMEAKTKDEVIRELSSLLYSQGYIDDFEAFVKDVYLREKEGITGLGNNVAIPHGKSSCVKKPAIAIGTTKCLIDWESYDDQPACLFFLFAVPSDVEGSRTHLKLLSQLATKLADEQLLDKVKQAKTFNQMKTLLT